MWIWIFLAVSALCCAIGFKKFVWFLSIGLYLVIGEKHSMNGHTYSIMPTLVCLPNRNEDGNWTNSILINPKFEDIILKDIKIVNNKEIYNKDYKFRTIRNVY